MNVPTMAEMMALGKQPEILFWVGCAGSFDDRAKKITKLRNVPGPQHLQRSNSNV